MAVQLRVRGMPTALSAMMLRCASLIPEGAAAEHGTDYTAFGRRWPVCGMDSLCSWSQSTRRCFP